MCKPYQMKSEIKKVNDTLMDGCGCDCNKYNKTDNGANIYTKTQKRLENGRVHPVR